MRGVIITGYHDVTFIDTAEKPQTNADRIRAMSDEELALLLSTLPRAYPKNGFDPTCKNCWLDWLRQEANT